MFYTFLFQLNALSSASENRLNGKLRKCTKRDYAVRLNREHKGKRRIILYTVAIPVQINQAWMWKFDHTRQNYKQEK